MWPFLFQGSLPLSPATSHSFLSDADKTEPKLPVPKGPRNLSGGQNKVQPLDGDFVPRFSGMGFDPQYSRDSSMEKSQVGAGRDGPPKVRKLTKRNDKSPAKGPENEGSLKPEAKTMLEANNQAVATPVKTRGRAVSVNPSPGKKRRPSISPQIRKKSRKSPEIKPLPPSTSSSEENKAVKQKLKKEMLPDLSPERNHRAISQVRKMIESFIDAASTKAEVKVPPLAETEEEQPKSGKNEFNVEIAARRLVVMAHRNDWIAFEQALK